jgi:hypothetical protein
MVVVVVVVVVCYIPRIFSTQRDVGELIGIRGGAVRR